ncbi:MAG: sulfatase [Candidatus Hydrogenedentes bacterium]|nr:sulfatase [Candidatus Hydrogenedentota bacterium]
MKSISRRTFNTLVASSLVGGTAATGESKPRRRPEKRPNVLFIAMDDMNTCLGCYGHPIVKSPNIDRLAAQGVRFELACCQYPLCNPSRTSLLTGLRAETTRIMDNNTSARSVMPDMLTLPQHFRANGYHTATVGKIFHGKFPDPTSWEEQLPLVPRDWQKQRHFVPRESSGEPPPTEEGDRIVWQMTDSPDFAEPDGAAALSAAEFLRREYEKPFFLAVGIHKPHMPYVAPKKYFDLYEVGAIPPPSTPEGDLDDIPPVALTPHREGDPKSDQQFRETIRAYYACMSFADAQVGVVLEAMHQSGHDDDTIVVFWSDHGFHLGEHGGLWRKTTLFEEVSRAPFIISAPHDGFARGVCPHPVEFIDIFPTLVEWCGLPAPGKLQGRSLVPALRNPDAPIREGAITVVRHTDTLGRSVRTRRWRYTEWGGPDVAELYDHQTDPREYRNLAKDPGHAATIAHLQGLLRAG